MGTKMKLSLWSGVEWTPDPNLLNFVFAMLKPVDPGRKVECLFLHVGFHENESYGIWNIEHQEGGGKG